MNVRLWLLLGAALAFAVLCPAAVAVLLGALGTVAVAASAKPAVWAFAAGLLLRSRLTRRAVR
jgi:hypothetical protein